MSLPSPGILTPSPNPGQSSSTRGLPLGPWSAAPRAGPPAPEGRGAVRAGPGEGDEDEQGAGAPLLWRKAEGDGDVQPGSGVISLQLSST